MQIVIPLEGRVRTVIRSSFVAAKRLAESQYTLSGDNFQMTGVTAEQVLILPDTVGASEGQTVTDEMKMQALPFEGFCAIGHKIRDVLGDTRALTLGCADELLGYLPTRDDIARGAYAALESTFLYHRLPVLPGEAERLGRELGARLKEEQAHG